MRGSRFAAFALLGLGALAAGGCASLLGIDDDLEPSQDGSLTDGDGGAGDGDTDGDTVDGDLDSDAAPISDAVLVVLPGSIDFGPAPTASSTATMPVQVQNQGTLASGTLTVALAGGGAASFTVDAGGCANALAPGGSCTLLVAFAPTTTGVLDAMLTVDASPGGHAETALVGEGRAPARLQVSEAALDLGSWTTGTSSPDVTLSISNDGGSPSGTLSAGLSGADAGQFTIVSNGCSATTLAPLAACAVTLHFSPTSTGLKTTSLLVSASPGGAATTTLTGTGLSPGALRIDSTSHSFGAQAIGTTSTERVFTISNGGGTATGTLVAMLSSATHFRISANACTGTLAAAASCTVRVTFNPTSVGSKSATLTVSASPGGAVSAALTGTGTARLTLTQAGTGTGMVTSSPSGISCGSTCGYDFSTSSVVLTATAGAGSDFSGWSGSGASSCTGRGTCTVSMTSAQSVTATFMVPWTVVYNDPSNYNDVGLAVTLDSLGNVIVAGYERSYGATSQPAAFIQKYSALGTQSWTSPRTYLAHDSRATGVATDAARNVYVVGTAETSTGTRTSWLRKLDSNGATQWTTVYSAAPYVGFTGVAVHPTGDVYVSGTRWTTSTNHDLWVGRYNAADGLNVWERVYAPSTSYDQGHAVAVDLVQNVYVAGYYTSGATRQAVVRIYDSAGGLVNTLTYGTSGVNEEWNGVAFTGTSFVVAGYQDDASGLADVVVRKYTASGATTWTQTFNGTANNEDIAYAVAADSLGNVFVVGSQSSGATPWEELWMRKYSSTGSVLWTRGVGGTGQNADRAYGVATDPAGNVAITGHLYNGTTTKDDLWLRKYYQ